MKYAILFKNKSKRDKKLRNMAHELFADYVINTPVPSTAPNAATLQALQNKAQNMNVKTTQALHNFRQKAKQRKMNNWEDRVKNVDGGDIPERVAGPKLDGQGGFMKAHLNANDILYNMVKFELVDVGDQNPNGGFHDHGAMLSHEDLKYTVRHKVPLSLGPAASGGRFSRVEEIIPVVGIRVRVCMANSRIQERSGLVTRSHMPRHTSRCKRNRC